MSRSELRRALSLVIDRNAVAEAMGQDYTAAEGLVPYGILTASGEEFRVVNGTRIDNDPDQVRGAVSGCAGAAAAGGVQQRREPQRAGHGDAGI